MVMTPLDETRFYRLGNDGSKVGYGLDEGSLSKLVVDISGRGFPRIHASELDSVTSARLSSLRDALPQTRLVGQHFPAESGGRSRLEATERQPVYLPEVRTDNFRHAIAVGAVDDVMVGHAGVAWNQKDFPGIERIRKSVKLHPALEQRDDEDIPASLHPFAAAYLREELGHTGLIIPDWYDMGAISEFIRWLAFPMPHERIMDNDMKTFLLALSAGANFMPI
jgi:hypothetical protein